MDYIKTHDIEAEFKLCTAMIWEMENKEQHANNKRKYNKMRWFKELKEKK